MTTRQDRLTMIVAGLNANPQLTSMPDAGLVEAAEKQLAEIERVCPEATSCPMCTVSRQTVADAVAKEREACAALAANEADEAVKIGVSERAYPLRQLADAIRARSK